ncbi:MAG: 3-hydroxy-3-methylglutaryl CoA synthase [Firmicutes bacterium HGW-Firmicutes-12]|nr:MAG: 3-hydroxy-3-methylglutaryl CoA synthase [Firmicutes bacterium HGW-Firmicutes-12]
MAGITTYGAYIPYNRLDRERIKEAFGKPVLTGEKAVANYDEDSITMGVSAALDCCKNINPQDIDAIYFATTTSPYKEKQCATVISGVIDSRKSVRTADFGNSLRCGSTALLAAMDGAKNGLNVLLSVSDCRLGAADGLNEVVFGDGAVSFALGNKNVIAEILDWYSISSDFHDQWRATDDIFVRNWEERFCVTQGYNKFMIEAAEGVMTKTGLKPEDFYRVVIYAHSTRYQLEIAKKIGFRPDQIQDSLYASIGNTGAASAPMMLVASFEEAQPGDKILFMTYGEGSDAVVFEVTKEILKLKYRPSINKYINTKKVTMNYEKYLRWRKLIITEPAKRPRQERSSLPEYYRNSDKNFALYGCRCTNCGTPQFPPTRICIQCQAVDKMEKYRMYGKKATIASYTVDYLAESLDPPNVIVVVDFEGGGRMFCHLIDCDLDRIQIGMEVDMSYRRLFVEGGIHTYFWKAIFKKH